MTLIIAFAGRKQSGKSTSADFLLSEYRSISMEYERYAFADTLKKVCIDVLGLTPEQCYGSDAQKNELVNCYWSGQQCTAREVMQIVGTDWFRTMQANVWADSTIRRILNDGPDLAVIEDCRFPNEVEAVKNAGGIVIKLNRDLYTSDHSSEKALDEDQYDHSNFDLVINNQDMTKEQKNDIIFRYLSDKGILPL